MEILRNFVVFEGGDGSGTTTQLAMLKKSLSVLSASSASNASSASSASGFPLFFDTFEPTEGPVGRLIRSALKKEIELKEETIAFLFAADRNEHLYSKNGLIDRCKRGELAVCDRYILSSLVYQGISCEENFPKILNSCFPWPALLVFFDLDPEKAQERIKNRPDREIYETLDFQIMVRKRYLGLIPQLRSEGLTVEIIDAAQSPDEIALQVLNLVKKLPIFNR